MVATSFKIEDGITGVRRIGEELAVRYAPLSWQSGNRLSMVVDYRINSRLVSTETGGNLWADRFDVRRFKIPKRSKMMSFDRSSAASNARVLLAESDQVNRGRPQQPKQP